MGENPDVFPACLRVGSPWVFVTWKCLDGWEATNFLNQPSNLGSFGSSEDVCFFIFFFGKGFFHKKIRDFLWCFSGGRSLSFAPFPFHQFFSALM